MTHHRRLPCLLVASVLGAIAGCSDNTYKPPPPPEVDVIRPLIQDTTVYLEYPGRTRAFARVEIRARVTGYLESREFDPGQYVEEGQVLFKIEADQYEANVANAQAKLERAKANLEIATTTYNKMKSSYERGKAVAEINVLEADAQRKAAVAQVAVETAALRDAERNLGYTRVVSPIAGRASSDRVDRGNLVGAGEATILTTVVQDHPTYFDFEVNERAILPYLKNRPGADRPAAHATEKILRLTLADGTEYAILGSFDFIDNVVDQESGTIKVRAVFENDGSLADGLFARVGIPRVIKDAVLVPRSAIQRDLGGSFVLLVDEQNKVVRRVVVPSAFTTGEHRILESFDEERGTGLKADARLVVSNLQRARAGIIVAPNDPASGGERPVPDASPND